MSLKKEFDPYTVEEDYLIEDIIQRALRDKKLEYQDPDVVYDIFELKTTLVTTFQICKLSFKVTIN